MRWFGQAQLRIEALVEAHYAALYRYAYRLSGSSQEAEDLTQETFCLAQNKIFQLRDETKAKAWLFSILRHSYLHRVRTSKQAKQVSLEGIPEIPVPSPEPAPNFILSVAEDGFAIFITWFATQHPYLAAAIVAALLVVIVILVRWIVRAVRSLWRSAMARWDQHAVGT